jgi:DNA-binding transcriptional ArsR family regulator
LNVNAMCRRLDLAQPTVSHHRGLLRGGGLVESRRDGKQVFYSLNTGAVAKLNPHGGLSLAAGPVEVHPMPGVAEP